MIWGISETRDKKLLVCGTFSTIDGNSSTFLARLILPENRRAASARSASGFGGAICRGKISVRHQQRD